MSSYCQLVNIFQKKNIAFQIFLHNFNFLSYIYTIISKKRSIMIAKPSIYVIKLKRNLLPLLFLGFTFCLLIFSKSNLPAIKSRTIPLGKFCSTITFPFFCGNRIINAHQCGYFSRSFLKPLHETYFQRFWRRFFCFYYGYD